MKRESRSAKKFFNFTLIELLVVVAIIAILVSLIQPALKSVRENAYRVDCLNRLRNLNNAWFTYSDDNNGQLISAVFGNSNSWLPQMSPVGGQHWSIEKQTELIKSSLMYEYISSIDAYGCINREDYAVRTFSMSHPMNGNFPFLDFQGVDKSDQFTLQSHIDQPSERMTLIDDWNENYDNAWAIWKNQSQWWNPLPIRHGQGATLIFADGHSKFYPFRDPRTLDYNDDIWKDFGPFQANNEDIRYLSGVIYGHNNIPW